MRIEWVSEHAELVKRRDELLRARMIEVDNLIQSHDELANLDDWLDEMYPMGGTSEADLIESPREG